MLGTYQLEEFQDYWAKWEKFRLVAEQLKSERFMYLNRVGPYSSGETARTAASSSSGSKAQSGVPTFP
ncbi:DUF4231 domain-containing protein [Candidatus Nitrospira bockiana]